MRTETLLLAFLLAALATANAASAEQRSGEEGGFYAFEHGNFSTAFETLKPLATDGYAPAQYDLGQMYDNGTGAPRNYAIAAAWYRKAASQGYTPAEFRLGMMYEEGLGVPRDYEQAYLWLDRAAQGEVGDRQALIEQERDRLVSRMTPQRLRQALVAENLWYARSNATTPKQLSRDLAATPVPRSASRR